MNVIDHQNIGVNRAAMLGREQPQPVKIEPVIFFSEEARCAIVTALDDMQTDRKDERAVSEALEMQRLLYCDKAFVKSLVDDTH